MNDGKIIGSDLCVEFLETGDVKKIQSRGILLNQLVGSRLESMISGIHLRIKKADGYRTFPLVGSASPGGFAVLENQAVFSGSVDKLSYTVYVSPVENMLFYDVFLKNSGAAVTVDLIYAMDLGLAAEGHVTNNEAYNSQYIDHSAFDGENGRIVCSRQNQEQGGKFPYYQQGSLGKTTAFSTDGYRFFGPDYKWSGEIEGLQKSSIGTGVYQYEFAYVALQSEEIRLCDSARATFYGLFLPDMPKRVSAPLVSAGEIRKIHEKIGFPTEYELRKFSRSIDFSLGLCGRPFTDDEIEREYPVRRHKEYSDGRLVSFFTKNYEHVVLAEKERITERSHGHIIANLADYPDAVMTCTSYIYGVFSAQTAIGNTGFNRLITNCRNGLNVQKASGQRIFVKTGGEYRLLTMPSVFEMGFNYAKWLYRLEDDTLEIVSYVGTQDRIVKLDFRSRGGKKYDVLVYGQPAEGINLRRENGMIMAAYAKDTMTAAHYPDLAFRITADRDFAAHDDSVFYSDSGSLGENVIAMEFSNVADLSVCTEARLENHGGNETDKWDANREMDFDREVCDFRERLSRGINGFCLSLEGNDEVGRKVDMLNDIAMWYSHNARIHYSSPRGLEQYTGAAWGTRDLCQGPFEYFLVCQNFSVCRHILLEVYVRQYLENGDWPQWFMFDRYGKIQHHESHGDIIVWPLKALAAYIRATGDVKILDEPLAYTHIEGYEPSAECESLYLHAKRQIGQIRAGFIDGTFLSCYGGGDWDDTLQPARKDLAKNMVSGWTVALTYQAMAEFAEAIAGYDDEYSQDISALAENVRGDYRKHIVRNGVAAGFAVFDDDGKNIRYLLHPEDGETGINYRLLPMTRGIIAEIFTKEQVDEHLELILKHLSFPDGVRLMNTTCTYNGGENKYFMRAETAASFSREVSLQYVHAHIRFLEAMAKLNRGDLMWDGFLKVLPILTNETVANAAPRQSNAYFSSSDADFETRYDAMKNFDRLKTGTVAVKGGWRIYSSGPGIFLHQLIGKFLGIAVIGDEVIVNPTLPAELDGLVFRYAVLGKSVTIRYRINGGSSVSRIFVDGTEFRSVGRPQAYRSGGVTVPLSVVKDGSIIEVYLEK